MNFDPKKWLNVDPDDARKFKAEEAGNGKRAPSSRLTPPVRLPDPNELGNPVMKAGPAVPVAAQLAIQRLMSDEFTKAVCNAALRATSVTDMVRQIRAFLITGRMP